MSCECGILCNVWMWCGTWIMSICPYLHVWNRAKNLIYCILWKFNLKMLIFGALFGMRSKNQPARINWPDLQYRWASERKPYLDGGGHTFSLNNSVLFVLIPARHPALSNRTISCGIYCGTPINSELPCLRGGKSAIFTITEYFSKLHVCTESKRMMAFHGAKINNR